jgi:hypothetical protein
VYEHYSLSIGSDPPPLLPSGGRWSHPEWQVSGATSDRQSRTTSTAPADGRYSTAYTTHTILIHALPPHCMHHNIRITSLTAGIGMLGYRGRQSQPLVEEHGEDSINRRCHSFAQVSLVRASILHKYHSFAHASCWPHSPPLALPIAGPFIFPSRSSKEAAAELEFFFAELHGATDAVAPR